MKYRLPAVAAACIVILGLSSPASAADRVKVVASFSIIGDLVQEVGGERVAVTTLVGPNGDAHVYEPTPGDARSVAAADLVVVNGLGFEGWLDRLVEASGYRGAVAVASAGVETIGMEHEDPEAEAHRHGELDPHAWQSVANVVVYVENIADALCAADRQGCPGFRANAAAYAAQLTKLDQEIRRGFSRVPPERRKMITSHESFGYFAEAFGIEVLAPQGVSTEAEASARDVAELIGQIREHGVTAVFVENVSDPRLIEQIARESGVRPGGALFSDALSEPDGPAATYLDMMRHNAGLLQAALPDS